jgi:2-(3-amino-3-carboxypropyl)histidine synthase
MTYNLELDKIVSEIKSKNYKRVLVQLPDGLKPGADKVVEALEKSGAEVFVWMGSCFGACDLPLGLDILKIDLTVGFGHNRFLKEGW